jgi:hypothetical protein
MVTRYNAWPENAAGCRPSSGTRTRLLPGRDGALEAPRVAPERQPRGHPGSPGRAGTAEVVPWSSSSCLAQALLGQPGGLLVLVAELSGIPGYDEGAGAAQTGSHRPLPVQFSIYRCAK